MLNDKFSLLSKEILIQKELIQICVQIQGLLGTSKHFPHVNFVNYEKLYIPVIYAITGGIAIDTYIEYFIEDSTFFFYKDVLKLCVIFLLILSHYIFKVRAQHIFITIFYMVLASIMSSLPVRIEFEQAPFEPYYLKVELITLILTFGIGILVKPIHMLFFVLANVIFNAGCFVMTDGSYPPEKLFFYLSMNSVAGLLGYAIHSTHLATNKRISEQNSCITLKNLQLNDLNNSKLELIRILSHDLRTPFAQIKSLAELIPETNVEEDEFTRKYLLEASNQGLQLLDDVLAKAKKQKGNTAIKPYPVYLKDVVNEATKFFKLNIEKKELIIDVGIHPSLYLTADRILLQTLIRNILSNAIKFSNHGEKVGVCASVSEGLVCVTIRNTGEPISQKKIEIILNSNSEFETTGVSSNTGQGIGLQICKKIAEEHGGTFSIKTENNNQTKVTVCIPAPEGETFPDNS